MTELQHGFELMQASEIHEFNAMARLFRHAKTGAQLLSIENQDDNKVFGVTFATPPVDATGLPHIMEHSVLCGSRKYPVKEPFIELVKGSLQTFLNAMTYSDKTVYPVASTNTQDFYNLVDVYLDAVFYPLITPQTLKQEGWHYELDSLDGPLTFKGVVFNEMKGAYSDPDNLLARYIEQSLYPDTAYGTDSGGDPAVIPDLTYEQFKSFHDTYYHPSNALLYFYGDDDPEERLRLLDAVLSEFDSLEVDAEIGDQPAFAEPRHLTYGYAVDHVEDDETSKARFTINWALNDVRDVETTLEMEILAHILIGTPASPLRKALIDSGLGEDLAGNELDSDVRQIYFSTGLKGVDPQRAPEVETLVFKTLQELADNGIDRGAVDASLNTIEFLLREQNTGRFPRGLSLMLSALRTWLHGGDPMAALAFEAPLSAIKQRAEDGGFFEGLIRRYLLENSHRSTVLLTPDAELAQQQEAAEKARLEAALAEMDEDERQRVIAETAALRLAQETPDTPEALATIPSLHLEDLPREGKRIPIEVTQLAETRLLYHDLFTNGIAYVDLGFNLQALPQEYLPYVRLFGRALLEMGTHTEDYVRLSQRIGRLTGGISPDSYIATIDGTDEPTAWFMLHAKAMVHQVDDLLAILRDVLLDADLNNAERFRQIVLEEKASSETRLIPGGHVVVLNRLSAGLTSAGWITEQMKGVSYLFFLRELVGTIEEDWASVRAVLEAIREALVNRQAMLVNVTLDGENWRALRPNVEAWLADLPSSERAPHHWHPELPAYDEGLTIPAQVNYVGKGTCLAQHGYVPSGSDLVVTNYLQTTWLWEKVRVQGGAYGGFAMFDRLSRTFAYVSYRDPNMQETLDVYDRTGDFLRKLQIDQAELTKSIIGMIGELDAYQLPDAKGYTSMRRYLAGYSEETRQQIREAVLETTADDFRRFADVLDMVRDYGRVVVLGSKGVLDAANESSAGRFQIRRVM